MVDYLGEPIDETLDGDALADRLSEQVQIHQVPAGEVSLLGFEEMGVFWDGIVAGTHNLARELDNTIHRWGDDDEEVLADWRHV